LDFEQINVKHKKWWGAAVLLVKNDYSISNKFIFGKE
jgi:hypothetical protein